MGVRSRTWRLIGAGGRRFESERPGTLGGHRRTRIYGRLDCRAALRAIARGGYVAERVFFADEATAIAAGYRPCAVCLRAAHQRWKAGRQHPGDDLLSALVESEIDGERLGEFDLLSFCLTLLVAGNETTRNLLSHGLLGLATHPHELARLRDDRALVPRAVEEMLRWSTPILAVMRTATRDTEVSGTPVRAGERLFLLLASANRDESVFGDDAELLRITRDASAHVAFGFGEHFCLGAVLARIEARIAFEEMLLRFSRVELAGEVDRVLSLIVRGIAKLPVILT